jgi:hypothetical protein
LSLRRESDRSAQRRIAEDRWLVTAKDFDAWWDIPDLSALRSLRAPGPEPLAQAAADVGDTILTGEDGAT